MEDIILPNYLPELKLHWKKAMRWIYAYRIIFSVLYGGVLIFLSIKFGHMKFSIMIIHFFLLILLLLIWCIITFLWIKTSPERYKWFKIAQKNFNNDFEEVFYEKKKELYEYVFKKIMPTVEVDLLSKKNDYHFGEMKNWKVLSRVKAMTTIIVIFCPGILIKLRIALLAILIFWMYVTSLKFILILNQKWQP